MKFFFNCCLLWVSVFLFNKRTATEICVALPGIPVCIQQKIDSLKQQTLWNPPAQINEYIYAGRKVYVISARCCDFFSITVDSNCNYVCAPSGGFTGKGDRKCADFLEKAKFIRLVWKDERKSK